MAELHGPEPVELEVAVEVASSADVVERDGTGTVIVTVAADGAARTVAVVVVVVTVGAAGSASSASTTVVGDGSLVELGAGKAVAPSAKRNRARGILIAHHGS